MKRHDTHLLSDESEKEKNEDSHRYIFNNSKISSSSSEEKYLSKESDNIKAININMINQNYIENNNNNFQENNVSILSSKDLVDIFYNEEHIKNTNQKKKKSKKMKYFIKLRKVRLNYNNNDEIIDNCLTYNPTLRNNVIDKKINKGNRKCVSLTNNNNDKYKKRQKKKFETTKEKEILYFFYNDDNEGNKKLKKVINIINKQKLQLLKISKSNFSIKTLKKRRILNKKEFPLILKNGKKNNHNNYNIDSNNLDREVRIRKINYSKKIIHLNSMKLQKGNKLILNKNKKLILKSNNVSNSNTLKMKIGKTPNQSISLKSKQNNKNNDKIESLFNLYCGKNENKKIIRVKSTESLINNKQNELTWVRMNNYKENQKYSKIHNNEKENRKIIKKLFKIQTGGNNSNNYNLHFGNNDNCPLCQAIEHKNEENIKKLGIFPMIPNADNNKSQNSWNNRRVYSAMSRVLSQRKKYRESDEFDDNYNISKNKSINKSKNKSINKSKNKSINKSKNKSRENISNINRLNKNNFNEKEEKNEIMNNKNFVKRKLNINRSIYRQNNYSNINLI